MATAAYLLGDADEAIRTLQAGYQDRIKNADALGAVHQVISGAIASDGVIDMFQAAGLAEPNVGILSEDFLERLAALPHKN